MLPCQRFRQHLLAVSVDICVSSEHHPLRIFTGQLEAVRVPTEKMDLCLLSVQVVFFLAIDRALSTRRPVQPKSVISQSTGRSGTQADPCSWCTTSRAPVIEEDQHEPSIAPPAR